MQPKVSIVTVCLNAEKTIERTIKSVLNQTYSNIEYIIIDGVSTDRTLEIVGSYKNRFGDRLKISSERDRGIYDAMNKGIAVSTGEIIGIINSDDWYETEAVQNVVDAFSKTTNAVYYGILRCYSGDDEVMLKAVNYKYLHEDNVGHPSYFVSTSLYKKHGTFRMDYKYASDFEFMLRLIQRGVQFVQINQILANYSYGGASSKQEINTYAEYYKIRYEYGYLSKKGLFLRLVRNKLYFFFRGIKILKS